MPVYDNPHASSALVVDRDLLKEVNLSLLALGQSVQALHLPVPCFPTFTLFLMPPYISPLNAMKLEKW